MIEFRLPSLGAEMDEGTLLEWKVKPGEAVRKGQVVAVVDTSKSAIDVEIWQEGTVWELALEEKQTVPVGTVMLRLLDAGETLEHAEGEKRRLAAAAPPAPSAATPAAAPVAPAAPTPDVRQRVSPAARKRAAEMDVDVSLIAGTGPKGAVTLEDIEKAAAAAKPAPKDRGLEMRKAIGAAMARSKREIPHYYLSTEVPLARVAAWLAARNEGRPITGRVLMAVPMLKAVALALRKYPELNGFYRDGAFAPGEGVHVGVAISLRQGGLIAPAIRDVDTRGLDDLMRALADLVARARARALTLRSSEMSDATVTVTNLGDQGVEVVHGVIYPPQVALVGFGKPTERPWVEDRKIVVAPVVTLTLAADHRASDGHRGALLLAEIARLLQSPERLDTATGET
jgi:pyruvate dehydrogenase E2 component (dihydrolipoamide acetyltransferase)